MHLRKWRGHCLTTGFLGCLVDCWGKGCSFFEICCAKNELRCQNFCSQQQKSLTAELWISFHSPIFSRRWKNFPLLHLGTLPTQKKHHFPAFRCVSACIKELRRAWGNPAVFDQKLYPFFWCSPKVVGFLFNQPKKNASKS